MSTEEVSSSSSPSLTSPSPSPQLLQSPEELRVVRQWQRDAFWTRSVPLSITSAALTSYLIRTGRLPSHPRFGQVPKVLVASVVGYFVGKLSYMNVLKERLLQQAPNGDLARSILEAQRQVQQRQQQRRGIDTSVYDVEADGSEEMASPSAFSHAEDTKSDSSVGTSRPSSSSSVLNYDELRRRNRGQQDVLGAQPMKNEGMLQRGPIDQAPTVVDDVATPPSKLRRPRVNKYGDEIYD